MNEEEDIYQLRVDRINADIAAAAAAACEVVALTITKLTFEGPIILKDFSAYIFCSDEIWFN